MKFAMIGNTWFPSKPGGLDRYVYELIHHLASPQISIDLFGVDLPSIPSTSIQLKNLAYAEESLWRRLYASYQSFRSLRMTSLDAINIHFALYGVAAIPHLPEGVPVTCTFHGPWALESQQEGDRPWGVKLKKLMEQLTYRRCDRFIVLSQAFGTILHQQYQVPWEKIHVIPGGVDVQQFQPDLSRQTARTQLGFPADRKILFAPRRLVHRMGLDRLLLALAQVKQHVPEVWLAIAGKGPLRDALEQQSRELGLTDHVRFLGFVPDEQLPVAYQAADLTVIPSQSLEGFGLVVLESLACGTPVLCTPIGGMPEILMPFSPELVTDGTDEQQIGDRLLSVLKGEILLPSRADCRTYAVTHFDWFKIAQRVQHVLLDQPQR